MQATRGRNLTSVVDEMFDVFEHLRLMPEDWLGSCLLLVNPPGYAPAAFILLAELHGRIGHFPTLVRLRPKPGVIISYEVAELLNLQAIRDIAREQK